MLILLILSEGLLLAGFAFFAITHGFDGAGEFFLGGVFFFRGSGHDAAFVLGDGDRGFFDGGSTEGAEVVGCLEALTPCGAIHVAEGFELGQGEEEIDRLGLIDPFLPTGGRLDDEVIINRENGAVAVFKLGRDGGDVFEFAIEVFELVHHFLIPEAVGLEVADKGAVEDDEFTAQVALDVEVFVVGLDAGGGAHDIRNGCGGGDGEDVRIAHALAADFFTDGSPVESGVAGNLDGDAAFFFQEVNGILG